MTQVFDAETGVVTPVTVIEAGPCPVVEVRTPDADGYEAVQLAFDAVPERKLSKPEIGHLKKNGVEPHRHLVEFRGPSEAVVGEAVTVETFAPGDRVKVSGISIGGHVGGAIGGAICGWVLLAPGWKPLPKWAGWAVTAGVAAVSVIGAVALTV